MVKTLKSELKLRPTYDELVGMIESQGDPNRSDGGASLATRPPIEKIIDRRATRFRNNQFGSQFDFLGLKKQEEEKLKQEQRQTQLRQTAIATGTSVGMLNARASGTSTPMSFDTAPSVREFTNEEMDRMAMELQRYAQMQEERLRQSGARASTDLDEAHRQSLPVGVMDEDEEEDMPPLVNVEEGEEEEEFDDGPELIPADPDESTKAPNQPRGHKETIDYSTKITKWQDKSVQEEDIRFQLFLRGIELTPEQEEEIAKLKVKGKGRNQTRKDYLIDYVDRLIQTGKWTDQVNDQLLQKRMEWREMKKGKGKGSGSSSSGIAGAIASGVKEIGGAVLDAGKEAVKEALVAGARSAVMSLI